METFMTGSSLNFLDQDNFFTPEDLSIESKTSIKIPGLLLLLAVHFNDA